MTELVLIKKRKLGNEVSVEAPVPSVMSFFLGLGLHEPGWTLYVDFSCHPVVTQDIVCAGEQRQSVPMTYRAQRST